MAKCKMSRPERADYLRVFARHLLCDEEYETLNRAEWGSVFLLMLHQWTKGGSLPDDPEKLAHFARCTPEELASLLDRWPKLQPVEGQPGRVGIPYIVHEWDQVMGYYQEQAQRSALGVAARKPGGISSGEPMGIPNQDQDQDQDKSYVTAPSAITEDEKLFLGRALDSWPRFQPGSKDKTVPPSTPKKTLVQRWLHWTRTKKVTPEVLYLACWHYQSEMVEGKHYLKALMNFISPKAGLVDEHLEWARAEAERQRGESQ